jgi:hypothetical protein
MAGKAGAELPRYSISHRKRYKLPLVEGRLDPPSEDCARGGVNQWLEKARTSSKATTKELSDEILRVVGINNSTAERYELLQKTHAGWGASLDEYRKRHATEMNDVLTENLALREHPPQEKAEGDSKGF